MFLPLSNEKADGCVSDLRADCQRLIWLLLNTPAPAPPPVVYSKMILAAAVYFAGIFTTSNSCKRRAFNSGSSSLRHTHHFTPQGSQSHRLVQRRQFNRVYEFLELRVII